MTQEKSFEFIDGIKCYNPESAQIYHDYPNEGFAIADKLEKASFWCRSRNRILKRILLKYKLANTITHFLELGCGTGFFLRELAKDNRFELTGSDIYLAGLKYAKAKLPDTTFIQLDATSNHTQEKYDIIGAFDVIEHIENDSAVIANVYRSLHDGGYFIITVPQYQFLWSKLDELVKHKRRYRRSELLAKLRDAGFEISFQSSFVFTLFPLMLLSRMLDRRHASVDDSCATDLESRVKLPSVINWIFNKLMYVDECLIRWSVSLPVGGSLLVVARKANTRSEF
jgi:SAM-dependent methyltransferase